MKIRKHFTSVEHPQVNGKAETGNLILLRGLKRRLKMTNENCVEELLHVLWAYQTTPHSTTSDTHFWLTYGTKVVILIEIKKLNWRVTHLLFEEDNSWAIIEEVDLKEEIRTYSALMTVFVKQDTTTWSNRQVRPHEFQFRDIFWRHDDFGSKNLKDGKLTTIWEGPY